MIPKVIHYCWFGGNPLPELAVRCIESWKKYCPNYEIKEWNESNFDLNCCAYVKEAAESKKWAFVSDYARFEILYKYGGIYFDTDVELIKPIDDIIQVGAFIGLEDVFEVCDKEKADFMANPGLGLGTPKALSILEEILKLYATEHFLMSDGSYNKKTVLDYTTEILKKHGFDGKNRLQLVDGLTIYPADFFCPMNYSTGIITMTDNTRSIHHYNMSWKNSHEKKMKEMERKFRKYFGDRLGWRLYRITSFPLRVKYKLDSLGVVGTVKFVLSKF